MKENEQKKFVFADACNVPLKDGKYCVNIEQKTDMWGTLQSEKVYFRVEGPRFDLGAESIHSFYPPEGIIGGYGKVLPHIVLNRRTLPWERAMPGICRNKPGDINIPWLCLLILHEDEILPVQSSVVKNAVSSSDAKDVFIPKLVISSNEGEESCRYIDIGKELFLKIAPRVEELPWLCHAGCVENDTDAATAVRIGAKDGDGWHSVVMANRFPVSDAEGAKNHAYLVSLEGYENYESALPDTTQSYLRLFVLKDWEFYSVTEKCRFREVVENLELGSLTLPAEGVSEKLVPILQNGYVPVVHTLRNGEHTASLYRSCCVPKPCGLTTLESYTADGLYAYDPDLGVLDISYAVAWQAGRLAALNRQSIAEKIMERRRKIMGYLRRMNHLNTLQSNFSEMMIDEEEKFGTTLVSFLETLGGEML